MIRYFSKLIFLSIIITCCTSYKLFGQTIKEKLNVPFGTLVKMQVEIVDGSTTMSKEYQGHFLFRIISVDNNMLSIPVVIEFNDETGIFPNDLFQLYQFIFNKEPESIDSEEGKEMKKQYVGKVVDIVAYESGKFIGVPDNYFKYQPAKQAVGFHFRNYLVVVSVQ